MISVLSLYIQRPSNALRKRNQKYSRNWFQFRVMSYLTVSEFYLIRLSSIPFLTYTHFISSVYLTELGLSGEQKDRVCRDTQIVFHCAATLRLEANLKDAIDMNTTGTKRLLNLCKEMPNIKAIIHLSTAFCNCDQEVLLEKVYDTPHNPDDLIRCAEWMDAKTLDKITPDLLSPHPNTYTYSKRLAEILVQKEYPNLPVAITRPSIGEFI